MRQDFPQPSGASDEIRLPRDACPPGLGRHISPDPPHHRPQLGSHKQRSGRKCLLRRPEWQRQRRGNSGGPWASIAHAQSVVGAGDTVYFRGGTYSYTHGINSCKSQTDRVDAITLNKSGSSGNQIHYLAYPGEKPVFNFSRMTDDCRIKGFDVTGSWIHIKGLEVTGVPQNNNLNHESWGLWISGSNNTFEQINTHHLVEPGPPAPGARAPAAGRPEE
ncbi:hypothetical protein ACFV2X_44970, partial [Streptomyces sp. NPDC059679]